MAIGKLAQYFKYLVISTVAVILIIGASRQKISENEAHGSPRYTFIEQVEKKSVTNEWEQFEGVNESEVESEEEITEPLSQKLPGAYLMYNEPAETNQSYCKFNYGLPYNLEYNKKIYVKSPEQNWNTPYRILFNVTEAYNIDSAAQVTYASHMTSNFANFLPELLSRWDGLVVISAFVPDLDVATFLEQVNQICYCEPEMYRVSIHMVTHKKVPFSTKDVHFERPDNCLLQDSSQISLYKDFDNTMVYPVNVLRNVARMSALTEYVLLSDIELMPNKNMATGFLNMLEKYDRTMRSSREVFVIPIFEVEDTESIPENKRELLQLIDEKKAVYFHELVCEHCQKFPGIQYWLRRGYSNEIEPLITVKRHWPYHRWEPIFIGTNREPLYCERLSWEGLLDKMTQSLEMCLLDYSYTILDNAFLCHWPGIKKQKPFSQEWRTDYIAENIQIYNEIVQHFKSEYEDIPECSADFVSPLDSTKKEEVVTHLV